MKYRENQKGITLIEMVISLSISAAIIGGLGAVIYSVVETTGRGNSEIKAVNDLHRASYWIRTDARVAENYTLPVGITDNITFTSENGTVQYYLSGSELIRADDGVLSAVAQYISSLDFSVANQTLAYTLVSNPPGKWDISREMSEKVYLKNID